MSRIAQPVSRPAAPVRRCVASALVVASVLAGGRAATGMGLDPPAADPRAAIAIQPATAADVLAEVSSDVGSVVLVNVWATWCIPCRQEFPDLLRLRRELGGKRFRLVLVSADLAGQRPQVEAFLRQSGVDFPTFVKAQADQEFIDGLEERWSGALPVTVLFDRHGKRAGFWEGGSTYSEIFSKVKPLVDGS